MNDEKKNIYKTHRKRHISRECGKCGAEMYMNNLGNWRCPNDSKRLKHEKGKR